MAKDLTPDLILLDKDRAIINAERTAAQLADNLRTSRIPILYLTKQKPEGPMIDNHLGIAIPLDAESLRQQVQTLLEK
jgi:PleD family two-component response regulator